MRGRRKGRGPGYVIRCARESLIAQRRMNPKGRKKVVRHFLRAKRMLSEAEKRASARALVFGVFRRT